MKCPSCGAGAQKGKYCAECGAALDVNCAECGAAVPAGAQYCTKCGEAVGGATGSSGGGGGGSRAGWIIAAAAVVVVLLVLFLPRQTDRVAAPSRPTQQPLSAPMGGGGSPDGVLSTDMRTNADRLFNRIMTAAEQGDQAQVDQFMPMAIQAYEMVEGLDNDGLYHLGLLQLTAGDVAEASRTAQRILDQNPNHILALGLAATAAEEAGDGPTADQLWQRLLENYDQESGRTVQEYLDHQNMLPEYRREAEEATLGG